MEWIAESSLRLKSRVAGVLYLLAVLTAAFAEGFVHGKLLYVAELIPVACFIVVTLIFYHLFEPVNRRLALLAALFKPIRRQYSPWNISAMFKSQRCNSRASKVRLTISSSGRPFCLELWAS
jgi:hypothetical protein